MKSISRRPLLAIALASLPHASHAAMGHIATTYGLLPIDVGTAQALSLFNPDASAVYYNPAALAADPRGELTGALLHADHTIDAKSLGGTSPLIRDGNEVPISDSQQTLLGLKTNLSKLTKVEHPLYLGVMIGVEKFGKQMLAFQSDTSTSGQYFSFGRQPLFLSVGGATTLMPGIDAGASARVTLHADATLVTRSDLAGNTQYEKLAVAAEPAIKPVVGVNIDWGKLLCDEGSDCGFSKWKTAAAYRAYSFTQTKVNANAVIPGTIPPPGLTLAITTLDGFQPDILTLGIEYQGEQLRVGLTAERQQWSKLKSELRNDTVKDQANLSFRDTIVPRIGVDFRVNDSITVRAGVAMEDAVLDSDRSLDVNYLDNDRLVVGLGASAEFRDPWIFAFPVRLDIGYQMHVLKDRKFDLTSSQVNNGQPYETLETSGDVHVFAGSLTLKF